MEFTASIEFDAPAPEVAAMLADPEYARHKVALSGATSGTADVLGDAVGAFTVTTRRVLPTTDIPAAYRSFVGSSLEIRQVEAWEAPAADGSRRGTIALDVTGAPVRVTGSLSLTPAPDGHAVERIAGDIKASVPFVGKTIERAVADNVHRVVALERKAAADWLAGRR